MKKGFYGFLAFAIIMVQIFGNIAYADTEYLSGSINISGWNIKAPLACYATCSLTTENAYNGNSLHWTKKSGSIANTYAIMERNVAVRQDRTYRCELWAKGKKVKDVQYAVSYGNRQSLTPIGDTFDWMHLKYDYKHTGADGSVAVQLILNGSVGDLWLDDIKFYELNTDGTEGENMFADYNFDGGKSLDTKSSYIEKTAYNAFLKKGNISLTEYKDLWGCSNFLPVYRAGTIEIDASADDWDGSLTGFTLPTEENHVTKVTEWSGAKDCSGDFHFAYDDDYFYILAEVTDDKHFTEAANMWEADSVQFNFSKQGTDYNYGFIMMHTDDGGVCKVTKGADEAAAERIKVKTALNGENVTYEAAVPWEVLFENPKEDLTFDILINDNDGSGRAAFIQWKYGIGEGKGGEKFGRLQLMEDSDEVFAWFPEEIEKVQNNEETKTSVCIANSTANTKRLTYKDGTVDVPANSVILKETALITEEVGTVPLTVEFKDDEGNYEARIVVSSERNVEEYETEFKAFEKSRIPEVEKLIKECKEKGYSTDYEEVSLTVMKMFVQYGIDDAKNDMKTRAEYVYNKLTDLADRAENDLNAYLSGEKTPRQANRYVTSDVTTDGVSFIAEDSEGSERPMFFTGYGHFAQAVADIPNFQSLGANIIEIEIGPASVVTKGTGEEFGINTSTIQSYILSALDRAAENNVAVNVLLSPHYIPDWFKKEYPEACDAGYFDSDPKMKGMLEVYLRALIPMIKDHPALHSVCLSNESTYVTADYPEHLPSYREYLKGLYKDISKLNETYHSTYSSFDAIPFPDTNLAYAADAEETIDKMPQYYDWVMFNNKFQADFHEWMYNIIQEEAPGLLATSKHMQTFDGDERDWRRNFINRGPDFEMLSEFLPVNGNDANNYLRNTTWGILNKMSFYDLQTSLRRAPVFDLEDHVINDRSANYSDEWQTHLESDIWMGTIHGRGASTIWVWSRSYDKNSDFAGSILHRPDVIDTSGRTMLDMGRLYEELTALETSERTVGILCSNAARIYSMYHNNALTKAYEAASYLGERIEFVTEKQAKEGKLENSDVKLLIVPEESHVLTGTPEAVKRFIERGGRVVILGEDSFSYNEYHRPADEGTRNYIMNNSRVVPAEKNEKDKILSPSSKELWEILLDEKEKCSDKIPVTVTNRATGQPMYGVSCITAEKDRKLLINLCNYEYDTLKYIDVRYKDSIIGDLEELRTESEGSGGGLILYPYHPILLSVDMKTLDTKRKEFSDLDGHWARTVITDLYNDGIIAGVSATEYAPDRTVTVGEFAALAARTVGLNDEALLSALPERSKNDEITREEMAVILIKAYGALKEEIPEGSISGYDDADEVKYTDEMASAVRLGMIQGVDEKTLMPYATATRAQAAAVIKRLAAALEFDYNKEITAADTEGLNNINTVKIVG